MSAVLDLYTRRARGSARVRLACREGWLVITWPWAVDRHELAKLGSGLKSKGADELLSEVDAVVDCQGATYEVHKEQT